MGSATGMGLITRLQSRLLEYLERLVSESVTDGSSLSLDEEKCVLFGHTLTEKSTGSLREAFDLALFLTQPESDVKNIKIDISLNWLAQSCLYRQDWASFL